MDVSGPVAARSSLPLAELRSVRRAKESPTRTPTDTVIAASGTCHGWYERRTTSSIVSCCCHVQQRYLRVLKASRVFPRGIPQPCNISSHRSWCIGVVVKEPTLAGVSSRRRAFHLSLVCSEDFSRATRRTRDRRMVPVIIAVLDLDLRRIPKAFRRNEWYGVTSGNQEAFISSCLGLASPFWLLVDLRCPRVCWDDKDYSAEDLLVVTFFD
jgi:hypothetical protein